MVSMKYSEPANFKKKDPLPEVRVFSASLDDRNAQDAKIRCLKIYLGSSKLATIWPYNGPMA